MQAPNSHPKTNPRRVLDLAYELGFALVGIAPAKPSGHGEYVRRWITQGRHGEMAYLENHLETRLDPGKLLPGARSVICVADLHPADTSHEPQGPAPHGRIARYAFGDDYHKTLKKRLHKLADSLLAEHPTEQFRSTVDTAPILEREHAARAGLGWIGKHTLLIHPYLGSYMLLGTIVTTLKLTTTQDANYPTPTVPPTDHCGTCTRCIDACPTNCISTTGPRSVDATRCISYLTLEHRSPIDPALHPLIGDWIAGCDICQEVCPYNRDREAGVGEQGSGNGERGPGNGDRGLGSGDQGSGNRDQVSGSGDQEASAMSVQDADLVDEATPPPRLRFSVPPIHPAYTPRPPAPGISLLNILRWTEEDRRAAFKGSALKRIKLDMLKRNALIAAGNFLDRHQDAELRQRIGHTADDENEPDLVRVTARQVLDRLGHGTGHDDP